MFDGKPLNLLYEENRYMAERGSSREHVSFHSSPPLFGISFNGLVERTKSSEEVRGVGM